MKTTSLLLVVTLLFALPAMTQTKPAAKPPLKTRAQLQAEITELQTQVAELKSTKEAQDNVIYGLTENNTQLGEQLKSTKDTLRFVAQQRNAILGFINWWAAPLPSDIREDTWASERHRILGDLREASTQLIPRGDPVNPYKPLTALDEFILGLIEANKKLTDKYNDLLTQANVVIAQLNARVARQQQINNALAIYSLMPKYQPPQTINLQILDCTRFPALCVH